jgi:hypothetical protein
MRHAFGDRDSFGDTVNSSKRASDASRETERISSPSTTPIPASQRPHGLARHVGADRRPSREARRGTQVYGVRAGSRPPQPRTFGLIPMFHVKLVGAEVVRTHSSQVFVDSQGRAKSLHGASHRSPLVPPGAFRVQSTKIRGQLRSSVVWETPARMASSGAGEPGVYLKLPAARSLACFT